MVFGKMKSFVKGEDPAVEEAPRVPPTEYKISIVRVKPQPRKHKVLSFGYKVTENGEVPDVYKFEYQADPDMPEILHPGCIPAKFSAGVPVDDVWVYFHTREAMDKSGPEYQVAFPEPNQVLLDWTADVDTLWVETMQALEEGGNLSEKALNFLDVDPIFLFGIADPSTQRAIEKAASVPMLRCMDQRPCLEEWFAYLNANPTGSDAEYKWVIESFAECELPVPWTSFKGVGSIVCYLNNDTNETTWKHPYYEYFRQLLDHCRHATREEHIKLRLNRMLWSYEADAQVDLQHQMPLVSPKYVKIMAEILKIDILQEPYMVRTLKTFLKAFSQQYRLEEELDTQEVRYCLEIIDNERSKLDVRRGLEFEPEDQEEGKMLYCVHCQVRAAECYCPECEDCFCDKCFGRIHEKGARALHPRNVILTCVMCKKMPAKLQCTFSFGSYCPRCYASHAKTLPKFLDLRPLSIDFRKPPPQGPDSEEPRPDAAGATVQDSSLEDMQAFSKMAPLETTLGERWHAFFDLRGVKYYYNFDTQESVRRPDDKFLDPEAAAAEKQLGAEHTALLRQIASSKAPRMLKSWSETHMAHQPTSGLR